MARKAISSMILGGVAATLMMPAAAHAQAQDRVSATEKGSLLIFSKVELRFDQAGNLLQDTFIEMTNDFPKDVRVLMYFVNGDAPTPAVLNGAGQVIERAHPGWNWVDNEITLTANQPTWWSAFTGGQNITVPPPTAPALSPFTVLDPGMPNGRPDPENANERHLRGFIYAWAVNQNGAQIRWNHLKGEGTLLNYALGTAWQYNAWSHAAVTGANGDTVGTTGILNLDGAEYSPSFDQLLLNFQAPSPTSAWTGAGTAVASDTDLTLHPVSLDVRQETDGPITTKAHFDVWNENEVKFSGAYRCVTCWDQTLLSNYGTPNHFVMMNLQTDHGKARIDGLASMLCDLNFDLANDDDFPFPPGPNDPVDTRDIISVDAAIIGVAAKYLTLTNAGGESNARAGGNLVGMGTESAQIQFDPLGPPDEAADNGSDVSRQLINDDVELMVDELINNISNSKTRR